MKTRYLFSLLLILFSVPEIQSQTQVPVSYDAMIRGGDFAEENFGEIEEMLIKAHPTNDSYSRRILLQFDLSGTGIESVSSADLKLSCTYVNSPFEITAFSIPDNWTDTNVNWKNAPAGEVKLRSISLTEASRDSWLEMDISKHVYDELQGDKVISILIRDTSYANTHAKFLSKEALTGTPVVVLREGTPELPETPPDFHVTGIASTYVAMKWSGPAVTAAGFHIYRSTESAHPERIVTLSPEKASYTDSGLEAGTTYFYWITSYNGFGESAPSDTASVTTSEYTGIAYYVDRETGSDNNTGTAPGEAWKSLERLNSEIFEPGDSILFHAGHSWSGELVLNGSGREGLPIVMGRYGDGADPHIKGPGTYMSNAIYMYNLQYWEIKDLKISNPEPEGSSEHYKRGIYMVGKDIGALNHVHFSNIEVTGIHIPMDDFMESRYYGGIYFEVLGSDEPTWFNDIRFEDCYFHHLDRTGLSNQSSWWKRGLNSRFGDLINDPGMPETYDNWVPSRNIVVRNCRFEHIGGNGLIMRVSKNTLVENNCFRFCAEDVSGNAAFCFNTDSCIFQFNEASHTVYNEGDTDARGIDSDFRTKHTIIQYNYLHNNGKGGVVATGGPGGKTTVPRFNDSTVIRYNVIANNHQHIFRASGNLTNMLVYNNVFFSDETIDNINITETGSWSGAIPRYVDFWNNIFYIRGERIGFEFTESNFFSFLNNCYYGLDEGKIPEDNQKIVSDPLFLSPEIADDFSDLDNFRLTSGSPCLDAGMEIPGAPDLDLYRQPIIPPPNIGADGGEGIVNSKNASEQSHDFIRIFPTIVSRNLHVEFMNMADENVNCEILDSAGKTVLSRQFLISGESQVLPVRVENHLKGSGIYYVRVYSGSGAFGSGKFIIL